MRLDFVVRCRVEDVCHSAGIDASPAQFQGPSLAAMRTVVCNDNNDRVCRLNVFVVKDYEGSDYEESGNIVLDPG